ncbi:MAG: hypothetical protein HQM10_18155 [Candidatus Riflebacteria bacterium]|nr:hypothetical protein [Candidatus Riflebacteria bacterium]
MTFKETDFPVLIKLLKTLATEETDPLLFREAVLSLIKTYDEIPVYPGIVGMCVSRVVKTLSATEISVGQRVFIKNGDDSYSGTVTSIDSDGVTLKGVKSFTGEDELEVGFKEMDKVSILNDRLLEETWPSLLSEKGKQK